MGRAVWLARARDRDHKTCKHTPSARARGAWRTNRMFERGHPKWIKDHSPAYTRPTIQKPERVESIPPPPQGLMLGDRWLSKPDPRLFAEAFLQPSGDGLEPAPRSQSGPPRAHSSPSEARSLASWSTARVLPVRSKMRAQAPLTRCMP